MPLLSLIGRLGLDTGEFESGLKKSEVTVAAFGNKFRRSIVGTVGSFFTLGYAINFVQDKIAALEGDAEKLQIPTGTLSEEIEAQQSAIEGLNQRLGVQKEIVKLERSLYDQQRENAMKTLSDEEKRLALRREMGAILESLQTEKNPVEVLKGLNEYEKLRGQVLSIKQTKEPEGPDLRMMNRAVTATDPLARIGGLGGRAGEARVVSYMERTAKATEETASNTGKSGLSFK